MRCVLAVSSNPKSVIRNLNSQRLQLLDQILDLLLIQLTCTRDLFLFIRAGAEGLERIGLAGVHQLHAAIEAAEARRVEALVAVGSRAEAHVVNLPVSEVRAVVAARASGFVAFKNRLPAPGRLGQRAILVAERIRRL